MASGAESGLSLNLLAIWDFTAAVLLPAPLASVVIITAAIADWPARKVAGLSTAYRYVYSTASTIIGAVAVHQVVDSQMPRAVALAMAAAVYVGMEIALMLIAMVATRQYDGARLLLRPGRYGLEVATVTVALAEIALRHVHLPLLWLSLPAAFILQSRALRSGLSRGSDPSVRPMVEDAWKLVAPVVIDACDAAAVMRVTTADPHAVALVARMQAGCDAIGMFGDDGLAILLAECPGPSADSLASRLRVALRRNNIAAEVAVAAKPRDGQSLADLLAVSEAELIAREAVTRSASPLSPEA